MDRPTVPKRALLWAILLLIPASLLLVGAYIFNQYFVVSRAPEPRQDCSQTEGLAGWSLAAQFVPMPYVGAHYCPNVRSESVNTNDLGYRGRVNYRGQIATARQFKEEGGNVVVVTGGSAAFGWASTNDRTSIVGVLNDLLIDEGRRVMVVNYAMGNYTSSQELAAMVLFASDLEPDLFVTVNGYNDMIAAFVPSYAKNLKASFFYEQVRDLYPLRFESEYLDETTSPKDVVETVRNYKDNMRRLAAYSRGVGAKLLIANQPILRLRNTCERIVAGEEFERHYVGITANFGRIVSSAEEVAGEFGNTQALDLTGIFQGEEDACGNFSDHIHLTDRGQRAVAIKLKEKIVEALATGRGAN